MKFNPQKTWFGSDAHYFHRNILKYSNRPFDSVEEMNEALINNHNAVVKPDDTYFHLGDFSFSGIENTLNILRRLNGKKYFILGNHDQVLQKNRKRIFDEGLLEELRDYKEIYVGNQFICLFHYGCRVWNKSHRNAWLLHGHSHGSMLPFGKSVDVGTDAPFVLGYCPYRPYSFYEIKDFMDKQETKDDEDTYGVKQNENIN